MAYTKTVWEDTPSEDTPIVSTALNNIENGIETLDIAYSGLLDFFYPVGTIYETTSADLDTTTKMANHFGGTWEVYGTGRVLVAKSADTEFDTIGKTGGAKTHRHILPIGTTNWGDNIGYSASRSDDTINVGTVDWVRQVNTGYLSNVGNYMKFKSDNQTLMQPYIVVYRYRRTA